MSTIGSGAGWYARADASQRLASHFQRMWDNSRDLLTLGKRRRTIDAYLARAGFKGLNCGQQRIEAWLNAHSDIALDFDESFRFPDERLDAVYAPNVIARLNHGGALNFLRECYRVLRSGGVMRLTVSDPNSFAVLAARLEHAGFRNILRCTPGESPSAHAPLRGLEHHGVGLIIEATK